MNSTSNQSLPDLPLNDYSDRQLEILALTSRTLDEGMTVQDSELWGYLQPVWETSPAPYIDFPRRDGMYYRWSFTDYLDGTSESSHVMEFCREAEDQPVVFRNLSGVMFIAVNDIEVLQGQALVVEDGDNISVYCPWRGLLIHDYYFRDPSTPRRLGSLSEKYDRGPLLGRGGFAKVFQVVHRQTRKCYVSKKIIRHPEGPTYEISCMKKFNHPNVCKLQEVFFDAHESMELVMEFCKHGDLFDYINETKGLSQQSAREITLQICNGMAHVHSQGIVHRDLKPENILIPSLNPLTIKISDFGLAKSPCMNDLLISDKGTKIYMAPEVVVRAKERIPYDNRVDSWSVGMIVVVMLTGETPSERRWREPITYSQWIPVRGMALCAIQSEGYHRGGKVYQFCRALLEVRPQDRTTLKDALDLSWLRN